MSTMKNVFVTVGTTEFDLLVESVTSRNSLDLLSQIGYDSLVVQKGRGKFQKQVEHETLSVEIYDYKSSIADDIKNANLVISHAGAGSILESLSLNKPLIVVVNEGLMDNHQYELAEKMASEKHLYYCTCADLLKTLKNKDLEKLVEMPKSDSKLFGNYVDKVMGLS